jgi:hypothetical protein
MLYQSPGGLPGCTGLGTTNGGDDHARGLEGHVDGVGVPKALQLGPPLGSARRSELAIPCKGGGVGEGCVRQV